MTPTPPERSPLTSRWPGKVIELRADSGERNQRDEATTRALTAYLQTTCPAQVTVSLHL